MNILILSWRGPGHPHAGGAEESTHQHAKGWIKVGHTVTLFTSFYLGAKKEEVIDGVKIIRQGPQILGVHLRAFIWYIGNHQKFDLVIDQFHGIPFFAPLYIKGKKLAFIHEVTKEVWRLNPWRWPFNLLPALIGTIFEPLIFKFFYKNIPFMTVSQSTEKELIEWGIPKKNISIIHNGFTKPRNVHIFPKEKNKTLIFLGALSKDKGIEDALKVFAILNKTNSSFQFWIVGKGEEHYIRTLKALACKLKIETKIKFWGPVSEKMKYELLSKAHILINPSIREGWGLVVIEAAAMGTPTVAFDVPGLRDSIINNVTGILSSKYFVENLAANIITLLENKKEYSKISRNAVNWSENFTWENAVKMSTNLIERI